MRHDGSIERFDELHEALRTKFPGITRLDQQQRTAGSSSISRFWFLTEAAFKEHQTWFLPSEASHVLYFPFAWYLERGMTIYNATTQAQYKVQDVRKRDLSLPNGELHKVTAVVLEGANMPKKSDRLRFPEENYIVLRPNQGRSWEENAQYENTQIEEYGAWRNVITYHLTRREAGSIDANPFGRHRERRPRHRSSQYDPNFPEYQLDMRGQFFDNIAQFDCWSTDTTEADILVDYFEQFMTLWTGVLGYNGIERIWFWGRGMDAVESRWRNDIHARSVQYFFRTEDVQTSAEFLIRGLNVAISVEEATGITGISTGLVEPTGKFNFEILES